MTPKQIFTLIVLVTGIPICICPIIFEPSFQLITVCILYIIFFSSSANLYMLSLYAKEFNNGHIVLAICQSDYYKMILYILINFGISFIFSGIALTASCALLSLHVNEMNTYDDMLEKN